MLLKKTMFFLDSLVCIIVVIAAMVDVGLGLSSRNWPTVQGKILTAQVEQKRFSIIIGSHDEPVVTYSFDVGAKTYNGNRIRFGGPSWNNADQAVGKFQSEPLMVHYDAKNPMLCTLQTGFNEQTTWLESLIALIFGLLAVGDIRALQALAGGKRKIFSKGNLFN